jgi:alkylation response protein AidB-like acyl-CoA dehydrogenase
MLPADVGGSGLCPRTLAAVVATLAEADASVAMAYLMHILGATAISAARPGETQAVTPILKEIAAGRHISTLAFREAGSRSHFWAPMSRAHRNGNGVRISARKSWVTSAGQAHSDVFSALAPEGAGPTDSTLYLLPAQTRGLAVAEPWDRKNARKPGCGVRRDSFSAWRQALRNYGDSSAILAVIQLDFLQPRLYGGESGILYLAFSISVASKGLPAISLKQRILV